MLIFTKAGDLTQYLSTHKQSSRTIGFAPTMGALHEGHLSLVRKSRQENDLTVCSIFVNPTQFNDPADLEKYPRSLSHDLQLLAQGGNEILFHPSVTEIYPPEIEANISYSPGYRAEIMEGKFRPGHFEGVVQVMRRLLDIVRPNKLYMGQKDFQQSSIIHHLLQYTGSETTLIMCPVVRESDGLAMSSRNALLNPKARLQAPFIYKTLLWAREKMDSGTPDDIREKALADLNAFGLRVEYFEIVDGDTLRPLERFSDSNYIVACVAAWAGDTRLIDNMILKRDPTSQN